jgi:hypothetical protein
MVELCTHLAIERARLVTPHLKLARPISIPTTESLKPIDKAIFGMVSKSSGRNESERRDGLESAKVQRPSPPRRGEGSMERRSLTDAASHSGGVNSDSTMTRTG